MFKTLKEFLAKFSQAKKLTLSQQKKAMEVFNKLKSEDEKMDDAAAYSSAEKAAKDEKFQENNFYYVSMLAAKASETKDNTSVIEILKTGKVHDRDLTITKDMLESYVKNFDDKVVGTDIQINLRHDRGGEAAGWVRKLFVKGNRLLAEIEWTPLGQEKIATKQYKFTSSELAGSYNHHSSGEPVENVLIGVALTNIPAIKGLKAVTLSEDAETYISNFQTMKTYQEKLAELQAKDSVTKAELESLESAGKAAIEKGELSEDDLKKEISSLSEKLEQKTEPTKKPEDPKKKEKLSVESLAQDVSKLAAENEAKDKRIAELEEKQQESDNKILLAEHEAAVKKTMCLQEGKASTGFRSDDKTVGKVAKFMLTLNEDQVTSFKEILAEHKYVDLSQRGYSPETEGVADSRTEKLKEANKKAQELHRKDSSKPLHEHLTDVMDEMGLTEEEAE